MDKKKRKSDIGFMTIVAAMAHQIIEKPGICGVDPYCDNRNFNIGAGQLEWKPGLQMQPKVFLDYFGDDTEFEYVTDKYGTEMITEVNGVMFHALISSMDILENGVLV